MGARIPQVRNVSFSQMPVVAEEDEPAEEKEKRDVRAQRESFCFLDLFFFFRKFVIPIIFRFASVP